MDVVLGGKRMSIRFSIILAAMAVMSVSAPAVTIPQTTINAPALATVDGILTYCRRVDPGSAANYTLGLKDFTQGHPVAELASIRASKQYANTMAIINSQLLKVSTAAGVNACRAYLKR